jgi:hypothetical protein
MEMKRETGDEEKDERSVYYRTEGTRARDIQSRECKRARLLV